MEPISVLILAGSTDEHQLQQEGMIQNKAFINLNGRPMYEYVLDCYRSLPELADIAIVGPPNKLSGLGNVKVVAQRGDMVNNVLAAADGFAEGWLLLSCSDIPLITPEAVRDFLSRCQGADLYYPVVTQHHCQRMFPNMQRTWVKVADGTFTGGNILLMRTSKLLQAAGVAGDIFAARKNPLKLARLAGVTTLTKLFLKRLTINEIENRMGKMLGMQCRAIISPYPELGTDVDKESDYNLIKAKMDVAK